jgi:hypothetical protein
MLNEAMLVETPRTHCSMQAPSRANHKKKMNSSNPKGQKVIREGKEMGEPFTPYTNRGGICP